MCPAALVARHKKGHFMPMKFQQITAGLLAIFFCGFAKGQSKTDFNMVFQSDTTVVAARALDKELFEGRYIAAEEKSLNRFNGGETRVSTVFTYAIDCKLPRKIALISSAFNLEVNAKAEPRWGVRTEEGFEKGFNFKEIKYLTLNEFNNGRAKIVEHAVGKKFPVVWPKSPNLVAEYACRVAGTTASAKSVSTELMSTGGITTLKELACEITFHGGKEMFATVRFDEELGFLQVNEKWKLKPFITPQSIGFTDDDGTVTRINRGNGKFSITPKEGEPYATGMCDVAPNAPKKF
jgi:hypothetical protein